MKPDASKARAVSVYAALQVPPGVAGGLRVVVGQFWRSSAGRLWSVKWRNASNQGDWDVKLRCFPLWFLKLPLLGVRYTPKCLDGPARIGSDATSVLGGQFGNRFEGIGGP